MAVELDPKYMRYNSRETQEILDSVRTIDDAPVAESENVVKSGGVQAALDTKLGCEDSVDPMSLFDEDSSE